MIYKYVPKHIDLVLAMQFTGDDATEYAELESLVGEGNWSHYNSENDNDIITIHTGPNYDVVVHPCDYIIKDESGKIKVMNPDEFHDTYRINSLTYMNIV